MNEYIITQIDDWFYYKEVYQEKPLVEEITPKEEKQEDYKEKDD